MVDRRGRVRLIEHRCLLASAIVDCCMGAVLYLTLYISHTCLFNVHTHKGPTIKYVTFGGGVRWGAMASATESNVGVGCLGVV